MGKLPGPEPDFAGLFARPSIERLYTELSDHEFEHFVKYIFEQAGYYVEDTAGQHGPGLDLKLYGGPAPSRALFAGVQVKHFQPGIAVSAPDVVQLRGGLSDNNGVQGYFITTSRFGGPALTQASGTPRIWPIDGEHLLRYIAYIRGTQALEVSEPEDEFSRLDTLLAPLPPEALLVADTIMRRPSSTTKVLTLANHKGGVGKTTTALNLAFGLARMGNQVLLVDMDAQANLTRALLSPHAQTAASVHLGEYYGHQRRLAHLVCPTQFPPLWLIPSDNDLVRADRGVAANPGAVLRFVRDLHSPEIVPPHVIDKRPFDWIIIDTGPSMGFFTRSALAASHYVVMPIAPGVFADMGFKLLVETIATMKVLTGVPIRFVGCLVTQWTDTKLNQDLLARVRTLVDAEGVPILDARIPLDKNNIEKAHLETAAGKGKTLFDRRRSKAANAYTRAVEEVLHHVNA